MDGDGMNIIQRIYYFFAPYTDPRERAVALFFKNLTEHSDQQRTRSKLNKLIQRDVAVINLWTEYRYKGYKYLRKSERKKLYANLHAIRQDFDRFKATQNHPVQTIKHQVHSLSPNANSNDERIVLLHAIMEYLSPKRGIYQYKESSSFGRLIRDPSHETLIGDCNQIVTLYIYLYSRYFDVSDLSIRLLPQHVALHYAGIDIETTNGTFKNYADKDGSELLPVEEIVSVNLLDTTDSYLATREIAAKDFLQASRFAFILSHHRDVVTHNLSVAYSKLITMLMNRHNYAQALTFAKDSKDMELLSIVGHNGAVHNMAHHHYSAARRYASYALKRDELIKTSYRNEGIYHYQAHRYQQAITAFKKIGDKTLIQKCYEGLYFKEQEKLGANLTTQTIKAHANTIKRMHTYAKKSGNTKLIDAAHSLRNHL
jgi:tetratricopeptide (TPR) repeat protein